MLKNTGIGRATAISFAVEGCPKIAISDRNLEGLLETEKKVQDVSKDVVVLVNQVDMVIESQIEEMVKKTVSTFGRVDYAVNAAGEFSVSCPRCSNELVVIHK